MENKVAGIKSTETNWVKQNLVKARIEGVCIGALIGAVASTLLILTL